MKIATWNVNSIKMRLPNLLEWLKEAAPDIVLLQELKVTEESDRKSTRLNSSHIQKSRMPSSA